MHPKRDRRVIEAYDLLHGATASPAKWLYTVQTESDPIIPEYFAAIGI
jgi:hypothetical protein